MVRKVQSTEEEVKELSSELQKEVVKLKALLSKLETNITSLESCTVWNGANAYEVNKSLKGHLNHDKTLLNKLEKCSVTLESLIK